jgi:cytochrome c biogenesis factor
MSALSRTTALKIAAILSLLLGLYALISTLPYLMQGQAAIDQATDGPPYFVILAAFLLSFVRIAGAFGTWRNQRWGIVLTIIANAVDALSALPGIFFAPTTALQISAIVGVVGSVLVIVLSLWRDRRPVPA